MGPLVVVLHTCHRRRPPCAVSAETSADSGTRLTNPFMLAQRLAVGLRRRGVTGPRCSSADLVAALGEVVAGLPGRPSRHKLDKLVAGKSVDREVSLFLAFGPGG